MRRLCVAIMLALSSALVANAQSLPGSQSASDGQSKTAYFVIDASDSMNGFQDAADQAAQRKLAEYGFNPPTASYTFVQGCRAKVEISEPGAKPARPTAGGGTPLGAALAAVLTAAKDGPADIFILSDAAQSESCGPDICVVARDLLPKPNIEVTLIPINANRQNIDRLACIEGAQFGSALAPAQPAIVLPTAEAQMAVAAKPSEVASMPDKPPLTRRGQPLPLGESWPWLVLVAVFAWSLYSLGHAFGISAQDVEEKLKTLQTKIENVDLKWNKEFVFPIVLFTLASIISLALLWVPWDVLDPARAGANDALNTQFGASVFLALLVMLAGFAGSQYWRYLELRRSYSVASNEKERDRLAKEDAERQRLHASYLHERRVLMERDYKLESYLKPGGKQKENGDLLQRIVDAVKLLVLGPELPRDQVTDKVLADIRRFNRFPFRFENLVEKLPIDQSGSVAKDIKDFLMATRDADDAENSQLVNILAKLEQAAAGDIDQ